MLIETTDTEAPAGTLRPFLQFSDSDDLRLKRLCSYHDFRGFRIAFRSIRISVAGCFS